MGEAEREALILLAYLLVQHGRLEKAETLLAALAEIFPEDGEAARLLADCLLKKGDYQEAVSVTSRICTEPNLDSTERRLAELMRAQALWGQVSETPREDLKVELAESLAAYLRMTEETGRPTP